MEPKEKLLSLEKATVYRCAMFGWVAEEAHDVRVEAGPYAQYKRALHVSYRKPRKRKREGFVNANYSAEGYAVVVIAGWGHPCLVQNPMAPSALGGSVSRYASYDPAYTAEFREALENYRQKGCAEIYDYTCPGVVTSAST